MCEAAFSEGGGCWLLQEKVPLMKKPRERNSRLNKTDKTENFSFARDILNFTLALIGARSSDIRFAEEIYLRNLKTSATPHRKSKTSTIWS
jgi:hypothetical protein